MPVITLSSEIAAFGEEFAERLADHYLSVVLDRNALIERFISPIATAHELHMLRVSPKYYLTESAAGLSFKDYLEGALNELSKRESVILYNCGGQFFLKDNDAALHLRLIAPNHLREQRFQQRMKKDSSVTLDKPLELLDRQERRFIRTVFDGAEEENPCHYHAIFNAAYLSMECLIKLTDELVLENTIRQRLNQFNTENADVARPQYFELKIDSEREFARLLDLYDLEWRYEPQTYPVEWDEEGNVTLAFSPDFYLPRFDLYLELTTMNQKYVRHKKKKAKKLQELYPGVNCRVVYKKDFESLFARFDATKEAAHKVPDDLTQELDELDE